MKKKRTENRQMTVILVGLDNAGKTTVLADLKGGAYDCHAARQPALGAYGDHGGFITACPPVHLSVR